MRAFLNFLGLAGAIGVTATLVAGYLAGGGIIDVITHVGFGLATPLVPIMAFSITLFYFIATGNVVRDNVPKGFATKEDHSVTAGFKVKLFPWLVGAMLALMAAPLSGAALDTGKMPRFVHSVTAWLTLAVVWMTWWKTALYLRNNADLLKKIACAARPSQAVKDEKTNH